MLFVLIFTCFLSFFHRIPTETVAHSFSPIEILRKRQFYILWFICVLNGQSILFISGLYKVIRQNQCVTRFDHYIFRFSSGLCCIHSKSTKARTLRFKCTNFDFQVEHKSYGKVSSQLTSNSNISVLFFNQLEKEQNFSNQS